MADAIYEMDDRGFGPEIGHGPRRVNLVHLAGAACSVALVLGLMIWGYQIAVRDVNGIPVMKAAGTPMRIAPDNPGGTQASHQGLSVNAVAAAGTSGLMPAEVVLAPQATELAMEDVAGLAGIEPVVEPAALQLASLPVDEVDDDAVSAALAAALDDTSAALPDAAPTLRPRARPQGVQVASVDAEAALEAALPAVAEVDPATLAAGTRLVQFGAFDNKDDARGEWAALSGRFADLMTGKSMVIEEAQSGGHTFYRLRAVGFTDEDDARRFCAALLAESANCIPVAQR